LTVPVQIVRRARQSTLNNGDVCLKRLEHQFFHDIPKRGSVNRGIGTGYHAGMATYYGARLATGAETATWDEILESAIEAFDEDLAENEVYDWRFQVKGYRTEEIVFTRDDAIEMLRESLTRYFDEGHQWPLDWQVVAVEMMFDQPWIPTWNRSGSIDLVLADAERYVLDDHKTAKTKWKKGKNGASNPQVAWYMKAWREHAGLDYYPEMYYDIMGLLDKTFERRPAPRSDRQVELTLARAVDTFTLIDKGGPFPPNTESFLCSQAYCDYWDPCPYGKGLSFTEG
jgi:hypothetical protein